MDYQEAYALSLRLLNVRFLSEGELRKKLKAREIRTDVIDEVIIRLKEERFIDDDRLAREVYRLYANKHQYGHRYICNRLHRRSLPIPDDLEPNDEYTVAQFLVCKRFPKEKREPQKIARFLQYRGFSLSVISEILGKLE